MFFLIYAIIIIIITSQQESLSYGCAAQYRRELRYLEYYLAIEPYNNGLINVNESAFHHYTRNASELNCALDKPCAWHNARSDHLLDTSDFYLFIKINDTAFPIQIQSSDSVPPKKGSLFLLAGNTTSTPQSAVLVSAPIACQRSNALLTFRYWLYNEARLEAFILKPDNPQRRQLQVLIRPITQCTTTATTTSAQPNDGLCRVQIPEVTEPFRIGIRAFRLEDESVGSFAMINNIKYEADLCTEINHSNVLDGRTMPSLTSTNTFGRVAAMSASDYDCFNYDIKCRWLTTSGISSSAWKVSASLRKWHELMNTLTHPNGSYFYQYIDVMDQKPYAQLQSHLIACTKTVSSLSFRYWLRTGTQVQICSMTELNVVISCAYLSESDSPGPITIDVDAPSDEPFRFIFEMIEFDRSKGGLVVIDDLHYEGKLCNEPDEPSTTTIDPVFVSNLFALQSAPKSLKEYPETLKCDFQVDFCAQWQSDGKWEYGVIPSHSDFFELPQHIEGNAIVAVLDGVDSAILTSRYIPCAHNATITITYYRSSNMQLQICIDNRCTQQAKQQWGQLSMHIDQKEAFHVSIMAISSASAIAIIRHIDTTGYICALPSLNQLACNVLQCSFNEHLCAYTSEPTQPYGAHFMFTPGQQGIKAIINGSSNEAILRSGHFQLSRPIQLEITLYQTTFGSETLLCTINNNDDDVILERENCQLLLGPRIEVARMNRIRLAIDVDVERIAIVAHHERTHQFGAATFVIQSIRIIDDQGQSFC